MEEENEIPFVLGSIVTKDSYIDMNESKEILNIIQDLMIEFGIIRIDLYINPYNFPQEIAKL